MKNPAGFPPEGLLTRRRYSLHRNRLSLLTEIQ